MSVRAGSLDPAARGALATARVLTLALASSCVLYVLLALTLRGQLEPAPSGQRRMLVALLLAMAGMGLLAAPFVRSAMVRRTDARGLASWFVSVVVAQALREGAAVMGLLLTLKTGALWPVVACGTVAIVAIVADWPRRDGLERHLAR